MRGALFWKTCDHCDDENTSCRWTLYRLVSTFSFTQTTEGGRMADHIDY